jgi:hypothetical protein
MPNSPRTFVLVTPYLEGSDVEAFQRTLTTRFDAWDIDKRVDDDGAYGPDTRDAARQICEGLGIVHVKAMRHGVTPDLRGKIRDPRRRTQQELARAERRKNYRAKLRERYAGHGPQAALDYARRHLGEHETNGPNRSPQIDKWIRLAGLDPNMNLIPGGGVPWCGCFVNACLVAAGLPNGKSFGIAAVEQIVQRAKGGIEHWQEIGLEHARPGDLACWHSKPFSPANPWAHVEIVEQRISPTTYVCIGGNTSPGASGSASNGGGVFRNTRMTEAAGGRITKFVRPPYNR